MTVNTDTQLAPATVLSRGLQVALYAIAPTTMIITGGPKEFWNNHGWLGRTVFCVIFAPSGICAAGAMEDTARVLLLLAKRVFEGKSVQNTVKLFNEKSRLIAFTRGALFPITGWTLMANLPVYDHYVFAVPVEVTVRTSKAAFKVLKHTVKATDTVLRATGVYAVMKGTLKHVVLPVGEALLKVANVAAKIIGAALGFAFRLLPGGR